MRDIIVLDPAVTNVPLCQIEQLCCDCCRQKISDMWLGDNKSVFSVITTGDYPEMSIRKMSRSRLESLVTRLVKFSARKGQSQRIRSKLQRPLWWPKHLEFRNPLSKLYAEIENVKSFRKWNSILRDVVACCSRFYRLQFSCTNGLKKNGRTVLAQKLSDGNVLNTNFVNIPRKNNCKENAYVLKKRHSYRKNVVNCDINLINLTPVVELLDISKNANIPIVKKRQHKPVIKLVRVLNLLPKDGSPNQELVSSKQIEELPPRNHDKCFVRLHDIYETSKPIVYDQSDYMKCLNLEKTNEVTISTAKVKPSVTKSCRNYNIPITSDLGQTLIPTNSVDISATWRIERLEWFLKEIPIIKADQEYHVSYTKTQNDDTHYYRFPKRQFSQTRMSLRKYCLLNMCKPVSVRLERLDPQQIQIEKSG